MDNIQDFAFRNIDHFSTAGLVTRMTTDVTNVQNAYQMLLRMCFRAPGQPDLRHADGVSDQRESGKHLSGGSRIFRCHHDPHYAESVQIFQRSLQEIR